MTPPVLRIPASDPFANVVPESELIPLEEYVGGDEENFVEIGEDTQDDSLPVDDERYRDLDHNLVSTKLKIFYPSEGWFIGTVSWYNSQLGKLSIVFDDGSDIYSLGGELRKDLDSFFLENREGDSFDKFVIAVKREVYESDMQCGKHPDPRSPYNRN